MRFKHAAAAVLALGVLFAGNTRTVFASDKTDVVATIHQFADNLDPKTIDKALAACDATTSIIDEFPPHVWSGPAACADWVKDFGAYNDKAGITDADAKIGAPWSVDIEGDRAYVVAPATYTFKKKGKPVSELHAVFTAVLRKTDAGWRIAAWSWAKH